MTSTAHDRPRPRPPARHPLLEWLGRLRRRLTRPVAAPGGSRERDAERRLGLLFERVSDGLLICGARGEIVACNPAAARLFGDSADALCGKPLLGSVVQDAGSGGAGPQRPRLRSGDAQVRRSDGSLVPVAIRISTLPAGDGRQSLVQLHDMSDRRQTQDRLTQLVNYDSLTGLPNRALFRQRLDDAMARARRAGEPMALMFLDLDRFKDVNDSLGHEAGDRLLEHVAETLTGSLRGADCVGRSAAQAFTVSRLGGDEFTVIVEAIGGIDDAALIAQRLLDALAVPFVLGEEELVVSASIGISTFPTDDVDLDGLLRRTDMAMYRAKSLGRGMYCFYSDDLAAAVSARVSLQGSLRRAVERNEFALHYQPKADLRSGAITGVEALLRWHAPGRGMVAPDRFIAVLEETGLIVPVGAWVLRSAIAQLAQWDREGLPRLCMAVNVSARQFRHAPLWALVRDTLREHGIEPARLEIELTESLLMEDNEATRGMLANFKQLGLRLSLDDFGTGHSSLAYLRRFNLHTLKIDRSFVAALPNNLEDMAIARTIVALGHNMNMTVVAEGVETEAQAHALIELGCEQMQGYLLSRPREADDFGAWLRARTHHAGPGGPFAGAAELQRIDIVLAEDDIWLGTESPGLALWQPACSVESADARRFRRGGPQPAAGPEPRAMRGGDAAAAAGADPRRRRLGQDAGADHAHRLAALAGAGLAGADLRRDLHEQGRQGDAHAPGGDAAGERARHVDRHLPRPGQPAAARALEAGCAAAGLPDPRRAGHGGRRQACGQGDEPGRGALPAQAGGLVHRRAQGGG